MKKIFYILLFFNILIAAFSTSYSNTLLNNISRVYLKFQNGIIFDNINSTGKVFLNSQESDTSGLFNKISKIWNDGQNYRIQLQITQYKDQSIKLSLYNLLGKEVKVIYEGLPLNNDYEYTFSYQELPNGVYLCVLNGHFYRDTKKIVISK
jgi:hypothetical protein